MTFRVNLWPSASLPLSPAPSPSPEVKINGCLSGVVSVSEEGWSRTDTNYTSQEKASRAS